MVAGAPVSLAYKGIITLAACATLSPPHLKFLGAALFYYVSSVLYTTSFREVTGLDYVWALRNLMLLAATCFFLELLSSVRGSRWERQIAMLSGVALLIFAGNVLLGLAGVGASQYGSADGYSAGGKGFIVAGNEMVTAMLAICGVLIIQANRFSLYWRIGFYSFMVLLLVMSGTKSGILGLLVLIAAREGASGNTNAVRRSMILGILAFAIWFGFETLLDSFAGRRFLWFMETEGIARAVLSNRDYWASQALSEFFNNANGFDYLFGIGANTIAYANNGRPIVEMDIVDFFITYGLIGVVVSHLVFFIAIKRLFEQAAPRGSALTAILLFFGLSVFTGHVLNGGTSAPYLGVLLAMAALSPSLSRNTQDYPYRQMARGRG